MADTAIAETDFIGVCFDQLLNQSAKLRYVYRQGQDVTIVGVQKMALTALDAAERAFAALRAPVRTVTVPHTPVPFSPPLEDAYVPSAERVAAAVREIMP
jgi:pyruvate/2-oxoglutarate/acetoin dehydrogenase E1 component